MVPKQCLQTANKLCIARYKSGTHPMNQCPNPEVSSLAAGSANAIAASAELSNTQKSVQKYCSATVVQKSLSNVRHGSSNAAADPAAPLSNALLSAQPYSGFTMLFAGTVGQGQAVNVMVDTGSTHCVCRPGLVEQSKATGKVFTVSVPGHAAASQAAEEHLCFTLQNVFLNVTACEMYLPAEIDSLLGQCWQIPHQVTLLMAQNQDNFTDDQQLPACWKMPFHLLHDPFNTKLKWSGDTTIGRNKQYFVAFVRHASVRKPTSSVLLLLHLYMQMRLQ